MDLAQILRELGQQRRWLAVGVVVAIVAGLATAYHLSLFPPSAHKKSLEMGVGTTDVVIDSRYSTIIDLAGEVEPLAARAQTYALIAGSPGVRARIAANMGIPPQLLVAGSLTSDEPPAGQRAVDILDEQRFYRVFFQTVESQAVIKIQTQALTGQDAVKLANAAASGLSDYVRGQQEKQGVPEVRRVVVRQIGAAQGGVMNPGVDKMAAVLTAMAAFVGWCLLVLFASRLRADFRRTSPNAKPANESISFDDLSTNSLEELWRTSGDPVPDPEPLIKEVPTERRGSSY